MKLKMKKLLILFLIVGAHSCPVWGQCNAEAIGNTCISSLAGGFNFVKSYKVAGAGASDKVEYSYVFTKGTQYMVSICEESGSGNTITVTIFDAKRNKVASNKIDGSLLSAIAFPCNATGIYYLQYTFEASTSRCGGSVLGFKK